jgi:hypothetical protein
LELTAAGLEPLSQFCVSRISHDLALSCYLENLLTVTLIPFSEEYFRHGVTIGRIRTYDARSALANSPNSALFKSDTAQNDMPL